MNKILNFKKKYINKASGQSPQQNNNNNNSDNNKLTTITKTDNNSNNNDKDNEKRVLNSKRVNKSNTPYISKTAKQSSGNNSSGSSSIISLFSKGKKSLEISNNKRVIQPFSDDNFLENKQIQHQQKQPQHQVASTRKDQQIGPSAISTNNHPNLNSGLNTTHQLNMVSQTEFSIKNRTHSNIDKLIESSKDEYNIKVKEMENKLIMSTNNNNLNNNDQKIQIMKKIINFERQMISVLDLMIEEQVNHKNIFSNIVNTSKKLSNHNFFTNNNNINNDSQYT